MKFFVHMALGMVWLGLEGLAWAQNGTEASSAGGNVTR